MPTVGELIEQVYDLVTNGRRAAAVNVASASYAAGDTAIVFTYPTDGLVAASDIIEFGDEHLLVVSIAHNTKTATVIRGFNGTTPAAIAANAVAYVQPAMWQRSVRQALIGEIGGLSPKLSSYRFYDLGPTLNGQLFYPVPGFTDDSTVIGSLGVELGPSAGDQRKGWSKPSHQFVRNLTATGGGGGVLLSENPYAGRELRLALAQRFVTTPFTDATDAVATVGLDEEWCDIVVHGAAGRMIGRREAERALSDRVSSGDTTKVQQGSRAGAASWFFKRRDELLAQAAMEFRGRFPFMQQW
jgi:hypothetical protein